MSKKYSYDEIVFLINEYKDEVRVNLEFKNESIYRFQIKFGTEHSYDSIKMLSDNILSSLGVEGYTNFDPGSKLVRETVEKFKNS